jgi:hypothetical protein
MIWKLPVTLGIAAMIFILGPLARADTIITPNNNGELIIPDGSLITATYFTPPGPSPGGFYTINFQFQGGYGFARGDYLDGDNGVITFTTPVSNLSFTWVASNFFSAVALDTNGIGYNFDTCAPFIPTCAGGIGVGSFGASGITSVIWNAGFGFGGISSMSYTVNAIPTPEPSTLLLLGMGLTGLVGSFRRKFSAFIYEWTGDRQNYDGVPHPL